MVRVSRWSVLNKIQEVAHEAHDLEVWRQKQIITGQGEKPISTERVKDLLGATMVPWGRELLLFNKNLVELVPLRLLLLSFTN